MDLHQVVKVLWNVGGIRLAGVLLIHAEVFDLGLGEWRMVNGERVRLATSLQHCQVVVLLTRSITMKY